MTDDDVLHWLLSCLFALTQGLRYARAACQVIGVYLYTCLP